MSLHHQQLAQAALAGVTDIAQGNRPGRFKALARKLPSMLQRNGLGQTLAFLYSKSKGDRFEGPEGQLLRLLNRLLLLEAPDGTPRDPMTRVLAMNAEQYRLSTRQALVASTWIKRFAEALIQADEEEAT